MADEPLPWELDSAEDIFTPRQVPSDQSEEQIKDS